MPCRPPVAAAAVPPVKWSSLRSASDAAFSMTEKKMQYAPNLPATRGAFCRTALTAPARRAPLGEARKPLMKWTAEPPAKPHENKSPTKPM
jgi:hypothetical protein